MNKVLLFGRLGRDPEVRATAEHGKVGNLSVATTERFKDKTGAWQEATEWHRVVVFGRTAETCEQYLAKGREVLVEGRLRTREWEDQNGAKRQRTEVVAANVTFTGARANGDEARAPTAAGNQNGGSADWDEDIPF
jgi:single-strand DNA-binding protein